MIRSTRYSHGAEYRRGTKAQEEDLCRVIPALYPSLCRIRYPYREDAVLITPHVSIMRNNTNYDFFLRVTTYDVNIVSVATPNLKYEKYDESRVIRTLENMYCAVRQHLPSSIFQIQILLFWVHGGAGHIEIIL